MEIYHNRPQEPPHNKIALWDNKEIRTQLQKLDPDQRYIVDYFTKYARQLRLAENRFCNYPAPPLLVVEGDAGSGKSEVIKILCQILEKELRRPGDDPDQPYILKGSFTGLASENIKGSTLTSMFNLSFGNMVAAMSDILRDKKRTQLQNLKILIIDEYSMVRSDMLYQIDSILKEIMLSQEPFGGISVVLFGNILQLAPVAGRYIFEKPVCEQWLFGHELQSLWELFLPIKLTYNHRQEGEATFAEMLKRAARGMLRKNTMNL